MFVPPEEIPQLLYRQDPRLAHKLNCICGLCFNLSVNNNLQPAARQTVNRETGISSPAQNIPASPFLPRQETSRNQSLQSTVCLGGLSPSSPEKKVNVLPNNKIEHTRGRNTVPVLLTKVFCSRSNFMILQDQDLCSSSSPQPLTFINMAISPPD
jgi:hypothetical protein